MEFRRVLFRSGAGAAAIQDCFERNGPLAEFLCDSLVGLLGECSGPIPRGAGRPRSRGYIMKAWFLRFAALGGIVCLAMWQSFQGTATADGESAALTYSHGTVR